MDEVDTAELVRQNMLGLIAADSRLARLQSALQVGCD